MVIDASVLAKLFIAEEHSDAARALLETDEDVLAPAHVLAELGEILVRKVTLGQVSADQCKRSLEAAKRLIQVAPLADLIVPATEIAQTLCLSVYDTLYLALSRASEEVLVTWDKRLLRGVQDTPFAAATRALHPSWTD